MQFAHHVDMGESIQLEQVDGIGIFRPVGTHRFQKTVALVSEAIVKAKEQGSKKMLVVFHELTGFQPPSLSERHWMIREWVSASGGVLTVALVVPVAFIDPEKFGVVAAANFGVTAEVFTAEADAMAWLRNIR
jgi:hypothetical protein